MIIIFEQLSLSFRELPLFFFVTVRNRDFSLKQENVGTFYNQKLSDTLCCLKPSDDFVKCFRIQLFVIENWKQNFK